MLTKEDKILIKDVLLKSVNNYDVYKKALAELDIEEIDNKDRVELCIPLKEIDDGLGPDRKFTKDELGKYKK